MWAEAGLRRRVVCSSLRLLISSESIRASGFPEKSVVCKHILQIARLMCDLWERIVRKRVADVRRSPAVRTASGLLIHTGCKPVPRGVIRAAIASAAVFPHGTDGPGDCAWDSDSHGLQARATRSQPGTAVLHSSQPRAVMPHRQAGRLVPPYPAADRIRPWTRGPRCSTRWSPTTP